MTNIHDARLVGLRALMKAQGLDALVVTRPQHRRYLSGFSGDAEEDGTLVVSMGSQWIVTDFRYTDQVAAESPTFVLSLHKGKLLDGTVALVREAGFAKTGFEAEHMTFQSVHDLEQALGTASVLVPTRGLVEGMRTIKDACEVAKLREAAALADAAFARLEPYIRPGLTEWDVAAELESIMRGMGSSRPAFSTIVASGHRGALPHGVASRKTLATGELVTIDFGAVVDGYHSDMTRTVALGEPSDEARAIYELVLRAQVAGLAAVASGKACRDVDAIARQVIDGAGYQEKFGHGLGHGVGLMIHEGPRLSPRSDEVLCCGHAVTVEPGIYMTGWGGVRIEDLVVVTDTGCEVLSRSGKELLIL